MTQHRRFAPRFGQSPRQPFLLLRIAFHEIAPSKSSSRMVAGRAVHSAFELLFKEAWSQVRETSGTSNSLTLACVAKILGQASPSSTQVPLCGFALVRTGDIHILSVAF